MKPYPASYMRQYAQAVANATGMDIQTGPPLRSGMDYLYTLTIDGAQVRWPRGYTMATDLTIIGYLHALRGTR